MRAGTELLDLVTRLGFLVRIPTYFRVFAGFFALFGTFRTSISGDTLTRAVLVAVAVVLAGARVLTLRSVADLSVTHAPPLRVAGSGVLAPALLPANNPVKLIGTLAFAAHVGHFAAVFTGDITLSLTL